MKPEKHWQMRDMQNSGIVIAIDIKTPFMLPKLAMILLLPLWFAVVFSGCKKKDTAKPARLSYTSKMGGMRNWHGSHYNHADGMHFPVPVNESYSLPDTSMAVIIVNDSTIQFLGRTFSYGQTDTPRQIYYFGTACYYYQYNMGTGVAYFYAKDSIAYCNGDLHGTSDYWKLNDLYFTY